MVSCLRLLGWTLSLNTHEVANKAGNETDDSVDGCRQSNEGSQSMVTPPPLPAAILDSDDINMLNIQIMVCTSAADCGVSAKQYLTRGKQKGITATMHYVLQNMGRVDRLNNAGPGECTYEEVRISFDSVVSLYVRIMRNEDPNERDWQVEQMLDVFWFLVVPSDCYHTLLEDYFEVTRTENKPQCQQYCSKCLGHVPTYTKRFHRDVVITLLTEKVFSAATRPIFSSFIKSLKAKKHDIFYSEDIPKTKMGPIHALALQLILVLERYYGMKLIS